MLTIFIRICDFFGVAASVWWILQLFDGFFSTRRTGKRAYRERAALAVFAVLFQWGMTNLSRYLSVEDEKPLLAILGVMSVGIHLVYECRYLDVICINILGWGVWILGELFLMAGVHLACSRFGAYQDIFSHGLLEEGLYLAAIGIVLLSLSFPLKRWISGKKYMIFRYRKVCYLLVFVMLPCILYAQWIYRQRRGGQVLEGWFLLPLYAMVVFFFYRFSAMKQSIEETDRMQQMKIGMLESNYRMLLEIYKEREILVHDMKNHMRTIQTMIGKGQNGDAAAYIAQIAGDMDRGANVVWTNHEILDLVLNMKFQEARKAQIEVRCRCDDMSGLLLSSAEICALFANLLDNAIEANEKCSLDMGRRMTVLCTRQETMMVVSVSNLIEEAARQGRPQLETSKQDKAIHGFGLHSIQKVLDSHDGYRKVIISGGEFHIVVYLVGFEK